MKQFSTECSLNALGILYYNSMTAFPLALLFAALSGEVDTLRRFPYAMDPGFLMAFLMVTSMGPLITYSSMLCVTVTSALTAAITGNVKDLVVTVAGALLFPGFTATPSSVLGLGLSFAGAGAYTWASMTGGGGGGGGAPAGAAAPSAGGDAAGGKGEGGEGGGDGRVEEVVSLLSAAERGTVARVRLSLEGSSSLALGGAGGGAGGAVSPHRFAQPQLTALRGGGATAMGSVQRHQTKGN